VTNAATNAVGGWVCGEIKLALMIRMLAGASYLDLLIQYGVCTSSLYEFFYEGVKWIVDTFVFPLHGWLENEDWDSLQCVRALFAAASGGAFLGCIGALDGLAVKIRCPTLSDFISDPGNYYCRKGFYALNVQAICDKRLGQNGERRTRDQLMTAFDGTRLNQELLSKLANKLREK
jgi:hypothetical protein